jgi:hypothetical protein
MPSKKLSIALPKQPVMSNSPQLSPLPSLLSPLPSPEVLGGGAALVGDAGSGVPEGARHFGAIDPGKHVTGVVVPGPIGSGTALDEVDVGSVQTGSGEVGEHVSAVGSGRGGGPVGVDAVAA